MAVVATSAGTEFPAAIVASVLRAELIEAVKSEAAVKGIPIPETPAEIAKAAVDVDSLLAVSMLCTVEPHLGIELPETVVKTGGYKSVDDALQQLLPRIVSVWRKKNGGIS